MTGILIQKGSAADRAVEEASREIGEKMAKDKVEWFAQYYWKKTGCKYEEFYILFMGKRDIFSGKVNISTRMYDCSTVPKWRKMGCQLWYFDMKHGVKKLEWILPLEDIDPTKSYTGGNRLIVKSMEEAERMVGRPITDRPK